MARRLASARILQQFAARKLNKKAPIDDPGLSSRDPIFPVRGFRFSDFPQPVPSTYVQILATSVDSRLLTRIPSASVWYADCLYPSGSRAYVGIPSALSHDEAFSPG
jgi:hypothetical protein